MMFDWQKHFTQNLQKKTNEKEDDINVPDQNRKPMYWTRQ